MKKVPDRFCVIVGDDEIQTYDHDRRMPEETVNCDSHVVPVKAFRNDQRHDPGDESEKR